ncbi:hypothetical protein E8E12_011772 [Didymella heteroderae]|uniref:ABM domain-containing protein n=1 Tax=Didymella heteroderae TaxID=1769908 RepID=A0A9P4X281_9PLEO|nr:hypothetical protein E8E12_011772 [Didymella heteroderae]
MAIVEVGMMRVQTGKTPMDARSPDGQLLLSAWGAVMGAPGGPQRVCWGTELEDASRIWCFFDWEGLEQHASFAKTFGAEATQRFGQVFMPGFTKHVHLSTTPLSCPLTEVVLASFPSSISAPQKDVVATRFREFKASALDHCADVRGVSAGWGHEDDFPVHHRAVGGDSCTMLQEKGCLFFALIGWGGARERMAFRDTDVYKAHIHLLTEMEGCVALSTFHLSCSTLERAR